MPNSETFKNALGKIFDEAQRDGKKVVEVVSGVLHRSVGGYPGKDHRMPACCNVMQSERKHGDAIIYEPPKGKGATLRIRYKLPR